MRCCIYFNCFEVFEINIKSSLQTVEKHNDFAGLFAFVIIFGLLFNWLVVQENTHLKQFYISGFLKPNNKILIINWNLHVIYM